MRRVLLLLLIPLSFTSLAAQDTLSAGDKVRLSTVQQRGVVGYWVSLDDNQLTLRSETHHSSLVLPLASLTKLEVSQGITSHTGLGAGIGFVIGTVVGGALVIGVCTDEFLGPCTIGQVAAGLAITILPPTALGALIGSAIRTEQWKEVPLDRIRVSLTPRGHGLEVSAKFVF